MVLTASAGKIPKDVSWNAGKKSMGNVDAFLKSLLNFDKDNIPEKCVETVEKVCTTCFPQSDDVHSGGQTGAAMADILAS